MAHGLLRDKEAKAIKEEAAAAEVGRLNSLSSEELAAEVMPALKPGAAQSKGRSGSNAMAVIRWLVRDYAYHPSLSQLADEVLVALRRLAAVGLLKATGSGIGTGVNGYFLSRAGEEALADDSVKQKLSATASPWAIKRPTKSAIRARMRTYVYTRNALRPLREAPPLLAGDNRSVPNS